MRRIAVPFSVGLLTSSILQRSSFMTSLGTKKAIPLTEMDNFSVGYCTDVEGNFEYWKRYINISKVLEQSGDEVMLKNNCHFVYGGDVCDRGPGDLRVIRDIVKLKKANPDRVHIILGNRDVNKMRLLTELQEEFISKTAYTYWTGELKQSGELTGPSRLRAIFEQTMGAPGTFEYRRQELIALQSGSTDEDVVRSFRESVYPDGDMLQFLQAGSLAVRLGDLLFIHGGTHENSVGWVPPSSPAAVSDPSDLGGYRTGDVDGWVDELEKFRSSEVEEFVRFSQEVAAAPPGEGIALYCDKDWSAVGGYGHVMPGSRLMQYGMGWMPDKSVNPTMIYDNFLDDGEPKPPSEAVVRFLTDSGVKKLIVGHQPHGDAPVIIDAQSIQILTGDTSYAAGTKWGPPDVGDEEKAQLRELMEQIRGCDEPRFAPSSSSDPADTRGIAVSEILFRFRQGTESKTHIHGCLQNGLEYNFDLPAPNSCNDILGKVTTDDWWVKGKMSRKRHLSNGASPGESDGMFSQICAGLPCFVPRHARVSSSDDEDMTSGTDGVAEDDIYLVCLSRGRDVFNSLETGAAIKRRLK